MSELNTDESGLNRRQVSLQHAREELVSDYGDQLGSVLYYVTYPGLVMASYMKEGLNKVSEGVETSVVPVVGKALNPENLIGLEKKHSVAIAEAGLMAGMRMNLLWLRQSMMRENREGVDIAMEMIKADLIKSRTLSLIEDKGGAEKANETRRLMLAGVISTMVKMSFGPENEAFQGELRSNAWILLSKGVDEVMGSVGEPGLDKDWVFDVGKHINSKPDLEKLNGELQSFVNQDSQVFKSKS